MSELVLPGPAPDDIWNPKGKGPTDWTLNGTNYWDFDKMKNGVKWDTQPSIYGNTNIQCPNDKDMDRVKYVWDPTNPKVANKPCKYVSETIPDG